MISLLFLIVRFLLSMVAIFAQLRTSPINHDLIAGTVLTWNINHANKKFHRENSEPIKSTICNAINGSSVVALQEADGFDYASNCGDTDYHCLALGEYVILAKTEKFSRIGKAYHDTGGYMLAALLHPAVTINPLIIVVNVNFCPGCRNVDGYKRKQILNEIKRKAVPEVGPIISLRETVVIILGSFNTKSKEDANELLQFKLMNNSGNFRSIHAYAENKYTITTVTGETLDGMMTNKDMGSQNELFDIGKGSPFQNQQPSSVTSDNIRTNAFYRRLVNNWNVATYGAEDDSDAAKLKNCIQAFTNKNNNRLCSSSSWISSDEVSSHLPLYMEIVLPSSKVIRLGTWNIGHEGLDERFKDDLIRSRFQQVFQLFDVLLLQEIPFSNSTANSLFMKYFQSQRLHVQGFRKYARELQYGIHLNSKLNVKLTNIEVLPMSPDYQFPIGFYEIEIKDNGQAYSFCLFSVHVNRREWNDTTRVLQLVKENNEFYKECQFAAALGDLNSEKEKEADIVRWRDQGEPISLSKHLVNCFHEGTQFTYTHTHSRKRLDYIFLAQLNPELHIGPCHVINTGDLEDNDAIQDWVEISAHYPVKADL